MKGEHWQNFDKPHFMNSYKENVLASIKFFLKIYFINNVKKYFKSISQLIGNVEHEWLKNMLFISWYSSEVIFLNRMTGTMIWLNNI